MLDLIKAAGITGLPLLFIEDGRWLLRQKILKKRVVDLLESEKFSEYLNHHLDDIVGFAIMSSKCPIATYLMDNVKDIKSAMAGVSIFVEDKNGNSVEIEAPTWVFSFINEFDRTVGFMNGASGKTTVTILGRVLGGSQ